MAKDQPAPIAAWHAYVAADDPALLDAMLHDEVVFESPVVHTPQRGKAITMAYLRSAAQVLGTPSFRYLNEWYAERSAILEFACEMDGVKVNGVDMIFWDEDDKVTHFKVMVRPLKAVNHLHQKMGEALAAKAAG